MPSVLNSRQRHRAWQLACAISVMLAAPGLAQQPIPTNPDAAATIRWGPFSMKSQLALNNLGVDGNVFNLPASAQPPSDLTVTFTPLTNYWLRMGRTWLSGVMKVDWMYFNTFKSQRGANTLYSLGVTRTINRVALRVNASRLSARDRPGVEIDLRSQRFEKLYEAEAQVRALSRTFVGAKASKSQLRFEKDAVFLGNSLATQLNNSRTTSAMVVRHEMTPLTTWSLEVGRDKDRFEFTPLRNSDSSRVMGTINLQPLALISGQATVGYRHFQPLAGNLLPSYRGPIANTTLSYRMLGGATRLTVGVSHDVAYSFSTTQPYFLQTSTSAGVSQQIYGPFDVGFQIRNTRLGYRDLIGAAVQQSKRVDRQRSVNVSTGYRLGSDKRVGFTLERATRVSNINTLQYKALRFGFSITYDR